MVAFLALTLGLSLPLPDGDANQLVAGPAIQNVTTTQVTILWETRDPCLGTVEIGADKSETFDRQTREEKAVRLHEITLHSLEPATAYSYRIRWAERQKGPYSFRTAVEAQRLRIGVYGDSRADPEVHRKVAALMKSEGPALVLHTGDLVTEGKGKDSWIQEYFEPAAELMATIPIYPCLGNHEKNSKLYYSYFSLPGNEAYYSFDRGPVHFVALDSNSYAHPFAPGTEQYEWLEQALARPRQEWIIVLCHHPLFSVHPTRDVNGNRWAWQDVWG